MSPPDDVLLTVPGGMVGFAAALRAAGVAADTTRVTAALEALTHLDPLDVDDVYWAGRLTLVGEPDDLARYDAVFQTHLLGRRPREDATTGGVVRTVPLGTSGNRADDDGAEDDDDTPPLVSTTNDAELLRHRDLAELDALGLAETARQIAALRPRAAPRRTFRRRPGGSERVDLRRTVRQMLRDGGEPGRLRRDRRRVKPRRLVLLLDVSGSMTPYADSVLRFAHAAVRADPATTEVFTLGTRLTRITRALRLRDPHAAQEAAARAIPDWSGGTRIGESLQAFLDLWGRRGTARRAVVVVFSDGWERGDPTLLGEQMRQLARLAHRVVWVHPHRGKDGFAPATGGMVAALPHVEDLVAGHTVAALAEVAEVIARA